jgi:hypothetical protein
VVEGQTWNACCLSLRPGPSRVSSSSSPADTASRDNRAGEGYSTREIAKTLAISGKTVDRHRSNILQKLGLRDRLALTRYAIRAGLIEP